MIWHHRHHHNDDHHVHHQIMYFLVWGYHQVCMNLYQGHRRWLENSHLSLQLSQTGMWMSIARSNDFWWIPTWYLLSQTLGRGSAWMHLHPFQDSQNQSEPIFVQWSLGKSFQKMMCLLHPFLKNLCNLLIRFSHWGGWSMHLAHQESSKALYLLAWPKGNCTEPLANELWCWVGIHKRWIENVCQWLVA